MEKKGNEIHLTSKAKQLLELVPEELRKPELTADWEMKLGNIAKGKMKQETFLKEIRNFFENYKVLQGVNVTTGAYRGKEDAIKIIEECTERYKQAVEG